jgi:hypothetical protein
MTPKRSKASSRRSTLEEYPDHVRAIGMISIENANLESMLATLFSRMLFIHPRVGHAIYLTPKSAIARIEIFENAAKAALRPQGTAEHKSQLRTALTRAQRIATRARTLVGKRHGIIHDSWGVDKETGHVERSPLNSWDATKPVPLATLQQLIDEFRQLIDDVFDLQKAFRDSPPTLVDLRIRPKDPNVQ